MNRKDDAMQLKRPFTLTAGFSLAPLLVLPTVAQAATPVVANPICPNNTAFYDPDQGKDIVVPAGFKSPCSPRI